MKTSRLIIETGNRYGCLRVTGLGEKRKTTFKQTADGKNRGGENLTIDKERLRVLASDCISHPLSRGISDIEEAGEGISALLSENAALEKREQQALQAASVEAKLFDEEQQKNAALAAEVERLKVYGLS